MSQMNNYDLLIQKLDNFIRKFYVNQLIRGFLYSVGVVLLLFLAISLAEYYFYFGKGTRKLMWFSFIGISLLSLGAWVILPLTRYFRLGSVISHEQAANIIGDHFGNVQDKLLNILQLRKQADSSGSGASLIAASIDQKSAEISPVPFRSAIDLSQNRRYLKYALPPLFIFLGILFAAPSLISDSTRRLINSNEDFERPAPFSFKLKNTDKLNVVQFGDYKLEVEVEGDVLPNEAYIEVDNYRYRLQKEAANLFTYQFSNVQESTAFNLQAGEVRSEDYELGVLLKPNIATLSVKLDYPAYLGRKDETLSNVGDLNVPAGTQIEWTFETENTDQLELQFSSEGDRSEVRRFSDDLYTFKKRALRNDRYLLYFSNDQLPEFDSIAYGLSVVPDLYPQITVESFQDSTDDKLMYFLGEASDDHGLSKLNFVYQVKRETTGQQEDAVVIPIQQPGSKQTRYDYVWDLEKEVNLQPGDELLYYFEVFDNDGVNGAKSARTGVMALSAPTLEELEAESEATEEKIKDDLEKAIEEAKDLQEDAKELREQLLQEPEMDWKMQKEVEKLMERQQEVQNQIDQVQQNFQENMEKQEQMSEQDQRIQEKMEQLQEIFEENLNEEMQQLMEDIEKLMEELDKDEMLEKMEDMEMNNEELEQELDRMKELYQQLELEQEMQETIEKLEELAEKQEELAEETAQEENMSDEKQEELQEKQEEIQEAFEEIQEKMDEMQEMNEELEKPMPIDPMEEMQESIEQDMQESQEQMEQKESEGASKKQQDAGQKMKSMSESMSSAMMEMQMEQASEDMQAIRQLLENIVALSFAEEELINEFAAAPINTPRYVDLVQDQFKLNNDFQLVQDSLFALAKRNLNIESFITEKVTDIKRNLKGGVKQLEERQKGKAAVNQQSAMTGLNDLALMLSESMEQMQQQMSGMMPGDQQCQNPGEGKGGKGKKESKEPGSGQQQSLNQALENMKGKMDKGEGGSSKEFAEMAARQAALRKALQDRQNGNKQGGDGIDPALQELIDQMDQAEEDLVNKKLTTEMMNRQEEILSKMLEHEKAEREQKMDEKRQSETAEQRRRELPAELQEYIRQRQAEIDMFKRVSPELKPYFQGLVNEYFQSLQGDR
ncbi:DUF4175 domain-containing protein [Lewinellaceae bacterium SD302]|nr:DUF4175 domain-containing protein [Lewinellaceae bacterium SD302]